MPVYTDKKTGRFFVQFDYQGQTYKFRLPEGTSKDDAEKLEVRKKNHLFFEANGMAQRPEILYEDFLVEVYLPFIEANRCRTTFEQVVRVCRDSLKFLKGKTLRSIRPADIERVKASRMKLPKYDQKTRKYTGEPRSASTIVKELSHLSKLFNMALRNDECDYNPCSRVEKPEFDNLQDRVLAPMDDPRLFAAFESDWARDVAKVILNTGLRQNDILGLSKFQIDWATEEIVLTQGKTRQRVRIPMNRTVKEILEARRHNGSSLFFPSPKTGKQGRSIRTALHHACDRAGISPRLGPRDLRRSFGTRLHELQYDDATVAQLLGHRDLRSVHRYKRGTLIKRAAVLALEGTAESQEKKKRKSA
jgi:integrase